MKTSIAIRETTTATDDNPRIAVLSAAMRIICIAHEMQTQRQRLTVTRPPQREVELSFTGRVPFGFAFTEGHDATFHVPSRHRFIIEQLNVSSAAPNEHVEVQLVTKSRHMFRILTVTDWPEHTSCDETGKTPSVAPIQVYGSSAGTFLFGSGEGHTSSTVPPDTYLQIWGYLEPTDDAASF